MHRSNITVLISVGSANGWNVIRCSAHGEDVYQTLSVRRNWTWIWVGDDKINEVQSKNILLWRVSSAVC